MTEAAHCPPSLAFHSYSPLLISSSWPGVSQMNNREADVWRTPHQFVCVVLLVKSCEDW